MFYIWIVVLVIGMHAFVKTQNCIIRRVNFTVSILYLIKLALKKIPPIGNGSLLTSRLHYVLCSAFSQMSLCFLKINGEDFFLGLHNYHIVGTEFWRNEIQKWEFLIDVSSNKIRFRTLRPACDAPADPGQQPRNSRAGEKVLKREWGQKTSFSSLILSEGNWMQTSGPSAESQGSGCRWAPLISLMSMPEPSLHWLMHD